MFVWFLVIFPGNNSTITLFMELNQRLCKEHYIRLYRKLRFVPHAVTALHLKLGQRN